MKTTDNGSSEKKEQIRARYKGINKSELTVIPAKEKTKLFEDTKTKRVAAYCRVSTDDVNQTSSYELQKNHYQDVVSRHIGWELIGIYADASTPAAQEAQAHLLAAGQDWERARDAAYGADQAEGYEVPL